MNYLSHPRLALFGRFQADVSTVNNDVRHYENTHFESRFQKPQEGGTLNGWWNPEGTGAFRLLGVNVRGAVSQMGPATDDPVLGLSLADQTDRSSAKLVDLDPQFQMGSMIWGLRVTLTDGMTEYMRGRFNPAPFRDLFFGRSPAGGSSGASAKFTSILTEVEWTGDADRSAVLAALRNEAQQNRDRLSISLMTFGYKSAGATSGFVTAAIGPWSEVSPKSFVAGRRFAPRSGPFSTKEGIGFFDAAIVGTTLALDLSNALPLDAIANLGALVDIGPLSVAVLRTADIEAGVGTPAWSLAPGIDEGETVAASEIILLEAVAYNAPNWLPSSAGIVDVLISTEAMSLINSHPLALVQPGPGGTFRVMVRETIGGYAVRADDFQFRVDAIKGASRQVEPAIRAMRFGAAAPDLSIAITQRGREAGQGGGSASDPNPPIARIPDIGVPTEKIRAPASLQTGVDGIARFLINVDDPENPRGYLDGQIYKLDVTVPASGASAVPLFDIIVLHVRDAFSPPPEPTWEADIRPILVQFGNLYPIMSKGLFTFSDPTVIAAHANLLSFALERPIDDPNHMPVTRDLSAGKRAAILAWLSTYLPEEAKDIGASPARSSALGVHPAAATQIGEALPVRQSQRLAPQTAETILALLGQDTSGKSQALRDAVASLRLDRNELSP